MTTIHKSDNRLVTIAVKGDSYYVARWNEETGKYKPVFKTSFRKIAEYMFHVTLAEVSYSQPVQMALF